MVRVGGGWEDIESFLDQYFELEYNRKYRQEIREKNNEFEIQ
jgi:hypothetical protein